MRELIFFIGLTLFLVNPFLHAAEATVELGDVNGMEVQAKFFKCDKEASSGNLKFKKTDEMIYRVTTKNKSNRSFPQVEIQSSLHVVKSECQSLVPGTLLPGRSLSALQTISLAPGINSFFEHIYTPPSNICPLTAIVKVRITYVQRGIMKAATLSSPVLLSITE